MKILLSIIIIFSFIGMIKAQDEQAASDMFKTSIGPSIAVKAGVNGGTAQDGRKNGVSFNGLPDFGITYYMPLSKINNLGFSFDLAYSNYSFVIQDVGTGLKYPQKLGYVGLNPNIFLMGALIGFNIGIPAYAANNNAAYSSGALNLMAELRLGYMYALKTDETGRLNVFISAGYMLTGVYGNYPKDDPLKKIIPANPPDNETSKFNPRVVSVSFGLNYLFNI